MIVFAYSAPLWGGEAGSAPVSEILAEKAGKAVTAVAIDNSVEKKAVFPVSGGTGKDREKDRGSNPESENLWLVFLNFVGSFLLLLALVWVVIVVLKKILPAKSQIFNSRSVEVLSRTHLDSRRYIVLVRTGARVLVVGVGPDTISVLSEITAAEEVAAILQEARPVSESGKGVFRKLLQGTLLRGNAQGVNYLHGEESGARGDYSEPQNHGKDSIHARLREMRNNSQ